MSVWDRESWAASSRYPSGTYRLTLLAKPSELPVSFEQACGHLRLGDPLGAEAAAQEETITGMIKSAVGEAQRYCDIAILTQKWRLTSDSISVPFMLPKAPLQSVDKITGSDGVVLDAGAYTVELDERLPGIIRSSTGSWNSGRNGTGSLTAIEFTAGWKTPDDVPSELVQALLLMVGSWFMNRESAQPFTLAVIPGIGVTELLDPFRLEVIA